MHILRPQIIVCLDPLGCFRGAYRGRCRIGTGLRAPVDGSSWLDLSRRDLPRDVRQLGQAAVPWSGGQGSP
jgi:hypothetical protein